MSDRRRATAAVLCLLLLQMLGLGSGALRAAEVGAECETTMARESQSPSGEMPMPADHDSYPPCDLPWAPQSCVSAAACLPVLPPPMEAPSRSSTLAVHDGVPATDSTVPQSLARTPELPPPRS